MSGTAIAQAIPVLIAPILSRTYSPEEFGKFSIFTTLVGLLSTLFTLKFEIPILTSKKNSEIQQIIDFSAVNITILFLISVVFALLLKCLFCFDLFYFLIPLTSLFFAWITIFEKIFNRYQKYQSISSQRIIKNGIEALCNLSVYLKYTGHLSLVYSFFLGNLAAFLYSTWKNSSFMLNFKSRLSFIGFKDTYNKYSNFRVYTLPHTLVSQVSDNIFIFLIPLLYSNESLGLLIFGLRLFQTPLGFISASLFNIFSQQFAENPDPELGNKLKQVFKFMCIIALIILIVSFFFPTLFEIIFGNSWTLSGKILRLLTPWILLSTIVSTFSFIPILKDMQKMAFKMEIINTLCKIAPFIIAFLFNLNFWTTIIIFAILATMYMLIASFWIYSLIKKQIRWQ